MAPGATGAAPVPRVRAPSCSAARRTRSRVSGATCAWPFRARETVAIDTPVCAAMSRTVTRRPVGWLTICYSAVFHGRSIRPREAWRSSVDLLTGGEDPDSLRVVTTLRNCSICYRVGPDGFPEERTTMSRIRLIVASLGTAPAAASATTVAAVSASAVASSGPAPVSAHVWVTTPDGADKLSDLGTVSFSGAPVTAPAIVVDPTLTFQTMQGFGGAITDSSATVLYRLSPAVRAATMRSLFDPVTGDGLDYLRQPIGASDFVTTAAYTYDDMPAGQTDYQERHFSIAHDQAQILPLLREAEAINPRLQIIATPWSPPAWMKTGGSLIGGRLIDDPRVYRSYALYLLKFVEAYRANGVTVDTITVQNEPQNRTPSGYPGTDMPSWQEAKVIEDLGPMLRDAGLRTQILAYDHNWTEHPNDIANT